MLTPANRHPYLVKVHHTRERIQPTAKDFRVIKILCQTTDAQPHTAYHSSLILGSLEAWSRIDNSLRLKQFPKADPGLGRKQWRLLPYPSRSFVLCVSHTKAPLLNVQLSATELDRYDSVSTRPRNAFHLSEALWRILC